MSGMKHRVIEHYELVRKLGTGGSGVVWLANDTELQRPVVLKLLQRGALTPEQMRTTYLREARLASAIEHPNVCGIYEVGEADNEAFIVMQYIPGKPLDRIIDNGAASLELVLSVGIQVADGLAAAHSLGIFHRDLKPANIILTDGGLAKILDFGLARRINMEEVEFDPAKHAERKIPIDAKYTARGGTLAYMAPEQFVTGQSSVQSDIFAVGVVLYELLTGRHPFHRPDSPDFQSIRAIQFEEPPPIRELAPDAPVELESTILHCLEKQPAARFASAAELRESLRTILMAKQLDSVMSPGLNMPSRNHLEIPTPEQEKRSTGILSMLAERFRESGGNQQHNTIVVLPFLNMGPADAAPLYGYALADAISARLARMQSLVVRPSSALMNLNARQLDPLSIGQKLRVEYVVAGSFLRSDQGFDLNWQMLDVPAQSVRAGGSINVNSFDLVAVQNEISAEIFAVLRGTATVRIASRTKELEQEDSRPLEQELSEEYLQARALLNSFMFRRGSADDLDRAKELFNRVSQRDPSYAPAWTGLGVTHLQYVRHGLGGQMHLIETRRALDRALAIDPGSVEANLYRVYMLLSRGEKESARHGIAHLLQTAGNDWNVRRIAGTTLRSDGQYEAALAEFQTALRLNPSDAAAIYNDRARVFQYQGQMELAEDEVQKGLTLEPGHTRLRITRGYQFMRIGQLERAIAALEEVIAEDKTMRIVYPTIAMCYAQLGDRAKASTFIVDETLAAAEADSEMAYRLATYFAVDGEAVEALHWLRRAVYLGNENYPWFSKNPAWSRLHGNADFELILTDLKKTFKRNSKNWKRLLSQVER
ncbi:serine/threonine protein kinase [Terriglobus roseus DSM 18391]|uniref:Serine/threonine protein kinase n=2 Tax=Terriglobus roseus TaxID=392734 RepID=I3ZGN2_TERRK|nr:serine/threonine protein kinase [Terriglobus roseus DSM 18391]AFL88741.1 serine/threonine protein kinase [Terriglobus roseus DSM 18391]